MTELRSLAQDHGRVLELLRTASPDTVVALLKHLRGTESQTTHLSELHAGLVPAHPPLQLDLNFRYPNTFVGLEPLGVADLDFRLIDVNKPSPAMLTMRKRLRASGARPTRFDPQDPGTESTRVSRPPAEPIHYVDSRLQSLSIRQWTTVSISNSLAAKTISFYLGNEHPLLALFDSDLFLRDLINGRGRFCSELLVSSLLAWSCVCKTASPSTFLASTPSAMLPSLTASSSPPTPSSIPRRNGFLPFFLTKPNPAGRRVRSMRTFVLCQQQYSWP